GRDLFSRILYGARLSVFTGLGVFLISTLLSTTLTLVSAYYIRSVDLILQRLIEVIGFLPDLIILIALFSIYGGTPMTFVLTLGVLNGINTSRVLRSIVIGLRGMPFVESAKAIGASDRRIITRHILPNVAFYIIVSGTGAIAGAIVAEAGLAIIGFGLSPTYPTWGNLMNGAREFLRVAPHLAIFPALMIAVTIFGFRLLGDALRDVLDPRLRGNR
ncbi:MAG: ABC transporter permease, partial [bacterium]|nr:ABC transporter permease [bacterium]